MELDHIFFFADPKTDWKRFFSDLGLVPTYGRQHPGQGTANLCYCFENAFLEILWVEKIEDTRTDSIKRCRFDERSDWPSTKDINPFGIAWRGHVDLEVWAFKPPYLQVDRSILVAVDSDRTGQPFMFTFPDTQPPMAWPPAKQGVLQSKAGFSKIVIEEFMLADPTSASDALDRMQQSGCIESLKHGPRHSVILRFENVRPD